MKKRFNAHRGRNRFIIRVLLWLVVIYLSLVVTFNVLLKSAIKERLNDVSIHESLFSYGVNQEEIINLDLLNPKDMFRLSLNYVIDVKYEPSIDEVELLSAHVNDENPAVYIYNTHDEETYDSSLLESYNIKYNVKIASYILSEHLRSLGITSYVEEASMADYLSTNGLVYNNSYEASRYYIEKRMEEYPSIELIVDLHRDSAKRNVTYASIDGKGYAKAMFVVGKDYDGYEKNLEFVNKLNSKLDERLRRGVLEKTGSNVNGIYNQDLSDRAILIEVGGVDNTIEEVNNTLEVIAKLLFDTIGDGEDGK